VLTSRDARVALKNDPNGSKSYAVLKQMELDYALGQFLRFYTKGRIPLFVSLPKDIKMGGVW
jgi:hypothetical protein